MYTFAICGHIAHYEQEIWQICDFYWVSKNGYITANGEDDGILNYKGRVCCCFIWHNLKFVLLLLKPRKYQSFQNETFFHLYWLLIFPVLPCILPSAIQSTFWAICLSSV